MPSIAKCITLLLSLSRPSYSPLPSLGSQLSLNSAKKTAVNSTQKKREADAQDLLYKDDNNENDENYVQLNNDNENHQRRRRHRHPQHKHLAKIKARKALALANQQIEKNNDSNSRILKSADYMPSYAVARLSVLEEVTEDEKSVVRNDGLHHSVFSGKGQEKREILGEKNVVENKKVLRSNGHGQTFAPSCHNHALKNHNGHHQEMDTQISAINRVSDQEESQLLSILPPPGFGSPLLPSQSQKYTT